MVTGGVLQLPLLRPALDKAHPRAKGLPQPGAARTAPIPDVQHLSVPLTGTKAQDGGPEEAGMLACVMWPALRVLHERIAARVGGPE